MDAEAAESVAAAEFRNSYRDFSVVDKRADAKAVSAELVDVVAVAAAADAKVVLVDLAQDAKDSDSKSKLSTKNSEKSEPIRLAFFHVSRLMFAECMGQGSGA